MNSTPKEMIFHLLNQCLQSELDISSFCEEFVFHYLNLPDGDFKNICKDLFHQATDFTVTETPNCITPEQIMLASDLFETLKQTYQKLLRYQSQS